MTSTLAQIIAITPGVKTKATRALTDLHQTVQKPTLLGGISRNYQPRDEEGEQLPPESTRVQVSATDVLGDVQHELARLFDVVLTLDTTNTTAKANVVVDDREVLRDVPVTYLLFLEKKLVDLYTFVDKLPVLDPAESWTFDPARGCYAADPVQTSRSKKVLRNHVLAEASEHHPAQVQPYHEDVQVGTWTTVKFSGALPATRVKQLRDRVVALQHAVAFAREKANSTPVVDAKASDAVFGFLFGED